MVLTEAACLDGLEQFFSSTIWFLAFKKTKQKKFELDIHIQSFKKFELDPD